MIAILSLLLCARKSYTQTQTKNSPRPVSVTIDIGEIPITVTSQNCNDVTQLIRAMDKVLSDVLYKIDIDDGTRTKLEDLRNALVQLRRVPHSRVQVDELLPPDSTSITECRQGSTSGEELAFDNSAYGNYTPLVSDNDTCAKLLPLTAPFLPSLQAKN